MESTESGISFAQFILSLGTTAAVHFGDLPDPATGERGETDLIAASQMIELLTLLQEKTRGNLDPAEAKLLEDLLFEGVFLAQIETDEERFTVADSLRHIAEKLIRRHPHVFGDTAGVTTPGQVLEQWEQIKAKEQQHEGRTQAVLAGVPKAMPALARANEISTRVAAVGFDWAKTDDVIAKIEEEAAELREAAAHESRERAEEEMGDLLFSISNLARKLGIEPESALRKANEKFTARFTALEVIFRDRGLSVHDATLEEMEAVWQEVKHPHPG